jgi:DNA polymerase-3 subunit alpha
MFVPYAILHLDADAFFASVEQASDARLRGKPVAVGGERRGIIASASYEARKFGIYTPMPTVQARRLCPKLILLPGDFEKYECFSRWMFSYAYDFTPEVEVASIDEGYFDVSGVRKPAVEIARTIREAIRQSLKISVSEGIATNKLVSQVASKLNKPAAFLEVLPGGEAKFLCPLPNRWLPGVGPRLAEKFNAAGLAYVGQIAATPVDLLEVLVGNQAPGLHRFARGLDDRPVVPAREPAKSFGQQETFAEDVTDEEFAEAVLRRMADNLMAKVRDEGKSIRTFTVKVRYNDMAEDQCSESLLEPTSLETDLYGRLRVMLRNAWKRRVSLRLISLRLSNLYDGRFTAELPLAEKSHQDEARRRLASAVDELRHKHGRGIILRGHDFRLRAPPQESVAKTVKSPEPVLRVAAPCRKAVLPVPLVVRSYYSFLNSTLSVAEVVNLAVRQGLPTIGLTDQGNLHGAVEFFQTARDAGVRPVLGVEVRVEDQPVWLYVENRQGYANLCRLLSQAASEKGTTDENANPPIRSGITKFNQLVPFTEGLIAVSVDTRLEPLFPDRFYRAIRSPNEARQLRISPREPAVAMLPVHYAEPGDWENFAVLQSIRTRTLLRQRHPDKLTENVFHFPSATALQAQFRDWPELLERTVEIAERCRFEFPFGKPQFPEFKPPKGLTSPAYLRQLVMEGLRWRYPDRWSKLRPQVEEELAIISEVGYEEYFLVVWDLLQECRQRGIDWLTRGSAADSLVCYCLGISSVCPIRFDLYFRRFLNRERMAMHKLPDIDVDFPHDRKDDVIDLIFARYGTKQCAVVGGFSTYQARGAVGDVGKVLGISEYQIRRFTEHFPWGRAKDLEATLRESQECRELPLAEEPYRTALRMAEFLDGFPRYAKMHPCGVVLSRQPMPELTPVFRANKGYPTTHFDMDAVEAIGLVKMDILAQGGLAVMRDAQSAITKAGGLISNFPAGLEPWDDPAVWEMISSGGARAVHHIESPAMISLCRQCNVREIDGLVAIVSVIRPGAANEQKKQRFVRRYQGMEPVEYPHPSLETCLKSTFGLVVYEEHILQICEAFAGLPAGRADVLRRALAKKKIETLKQVAAEFFTSARARGHDEDKIMEVWNLVAGFAGYAFCKAHSTAYGVEAYQAAWLKKYHPAEFMAAVLANGKGFYDSLVYVLECHRLGIRLLPPWINEPGPTFEVVREGGGTFIRVPVTRIKGLVQGTVQRIFTHRQQKPFVSLRDFYARVTPPPEEMDLLVRAGAFDGFGRTRTAQFWETQMLRQVFGQGQDAGQGWLLPPPDTDRLPEVPLQEPTRRQRLEWENELLGFTASGHPLELFSDIAWATYCPVARLKEFCGQEVVTCGLVIEQRMFHQATGEPMKFLTLADWTGMVETELFAKTYRSYGLATVRYPVLEIVATVEPHENGRGFSLRVHRAGKPRKR